jgi:hypothetical protein
MALSLVFFWTLILSSDTGMPPWPWYSCLGSAVACVWLTGAAGVISSRRCRFIFLTTTLQMSLVPFYAGIWLGMTTPSVTVPLMTCCVALRFLLRFYCASTAHLLRFYCPSVASTVHSRKRLNLDSLLWKFNDDFGLFLHLFQSTLNDVQFSVDDAK